MVQGARYRFAFDIGGTFTDFVLLDAQTGEFTAHKCLTTPHDPSEGALRGFAELLEKAGVAAHLIDNSIHGTTLVTNAVIERKGVKVALLTTRGFRDSLQIRNEQRYDIYDLFLRFPDPIVPRYLRLGIDERIDRDGRLLKAVDRDEIARALALLQVEDDRDRQAARGATAPGEAAGPLQAVAICFFHSYRNPENERVAARYVQELRPDLRVTISSDVAPEIREYERTSTAVINAYVLPLTERYLETLDRALRQRGCAGGLYLMLSSGGICTLDTATQFPVRLIESGPAGGAIGAAFFGDAAGVRDLVSFDMGGTTAKICLIRHGRPVIARQLEVARVHRFKRGSGFPVQLPSVDTTEIGAGGGSIAWIDEMGLLRVGPRSAGADPGPACYGQGGTEPTVTDADLVLGYLDPKYFLGGTMDLDVAAATRTIEQKIGRPLGLSVTDAAWGIHHLVNENMAAAARIHVIERGQDPRKYALLAFGGAGPLHASGVAKNLGQRRLICPLGAGVLSAIGFLAAPVSFELAQSRPQLLEATAWDAINALVQELEARGRSTLLEAGVEPTQIAVERSADARFAEQLNEITIEVPGGVLGAASAVRIKRDFDTKYQALYGHLHDDIPVEVLTWRVVVSGRLAEVRLSPQSDARDTARAALRGQRPVYWRELGRHADTPVYDRYRLAPSSRLTGPAVVEERESTLLIPPGSACTVDHYLNLVVDFDPAGKTGEAEHAGARGTR